MPKLSNCLPKYRKHRGSGQAIFTLAGKDHYLGPHGTKASRIEYDRLVAEWLASGRSQSFGAAENELSIAELLVSFLGHAKRYYGTGPKSEYFHFRRLARPLRELYSATAAAEFGPLQFKAIRERLVADGCSRGYVNHSMRRVARIFRWAASEGLIPATVPQGLATVDGLRRGKTDAPESEPIECVDHAAVQATLEHLPEVIGDMVKLQRLSGARPSEVCNLRPCDVERSADVWIYRPHEHKNAHHGHKRVIFFGPQSQGVLLRYLARDPEAFCFRPCDSEAKRLSLLHASRKTPLCCGNKPGTNRKRKPRKKPGLRYTTDSYRRAIHRACDKAFPHPKLSRIKKSLLKAKQLAALKKWQSEHRWSPNQLRHSAGTEVRRDFGLEGAQVYLGHSRARTTEIYAALDMEKGLAIAAKIGWYFSYKEKSNDHSIDSRPCRPGPASRNLSGNLGCRIADIAWRSARATACRGGCRRLCEVAKRVLGIGRPIG